MDAATCRAIENFETQRIRHSNACGDTAVSGLLLAAKRNGLEVRTIEMRNSGETAGDKSCVVGYGAWVFGQGTGAALQADKRRTAL